MKQITNKTILKQGDKTFQPVEVDGVVYWIDESFTDDYKLLKSDGILFTRDSGDREIYSYYEHDGYGLGVFDLKGKRYTISVSRSSKIVAQSQPKLEDVPVISLDSYIERLAKNSYCTQPKTINTLHADTNYILGFIDGYNSNPNHYTQADIEKAIDLASKPQKILLNGIIREHLTKEEILDQINSISVIEVDEGFNIISSITMYSVLSLDNIETFRKEYNDRMRVLFGVDDWIKYYEEEHSCKLEDFIGKTIEEIKSQISYIDRDWEE